MNPRSNATGPHVVFLAHWDKTLSLFRRPLMKRLAEQGWRVTAVTPEGETTARWPEIGVAYVPYALSRRSTNPLQEIPVILNLRRILRRLSPDIVHTFAAKPNVYGTLAAHYAGAPSIVNTITGLGSFFVDRGRPGLGQRALAALYRISGRYTNAVIFQNTEDRAYFEQNRLLSPRAEATLIRGSGVDVEEFSPQRFRPAQAAALRAELGAPQNAVLVTMIARLIWDKGVREFCEAARMLRAEMGEKAIFLSVGDYYPGNPGCVPEAFMQEAVDSGAVRAAGWREDIPEVLHASDLLVLPSYLKEGIPHSLQQACAMGKPIVTTDNTGCREAVTDGVNGLLVPVRDSAKLADAIRRLIEDPALRAQMGAKSREKALREFDIRENIAQHLAVYESLLARCPRR